MSIPTLQGLQTALSGLIAQQDAIDVTGSNITNANTEGYSRQTAVLQTKEPLHIAALSAVTGEGGQLGTGVTVATITRIRNTYLDASYREHATAAGAAGAQAEELSAGPGRVQRTLLHRPRLAAVGVLELLERARRIARLRRRCEGRGRRRRHAAHRLAAPARRPAAVARRSGLRAVRRDHRAYRRSRRRRHADRRTQPPDQALFGGPPAAQRTGRPPRSAARQALRAGLRHGHKGSRRHRHRHLRQRRPAARRRLDGQLAPSAHRRRRREAGGAAGTVGSHRRARLLSGPPSTKSPRRSPARSTNCTPPRPSSRAPPPPRSK